MKIGNVVTTPAASRLGCVLAILAAACSSSNSSTPSSPGAAATSGSPSSTSSASPSAAAPGVASDAGASRTTDGGVACDATFCDDFERDGLAADDWTLDSPSPEWATEASLDANAFNGSHAARFHTVGVPTDDTEDEHTALNRELPLGKMADVSFEFFAEQPITTSQDFAQVAIVYLPTGEGQPLAIIVTQQGTPEAATLGVSLGGVAGPKLPIDSRAWHLVRVVVDAVNRSATLSVDGTSGDKVSFPDAFAGIEFTRRTWSLDLGPKNTSGAPSVDFRYDAFRLTVQ